MAAGDVLKFTVQPLRDQTHTTQTVLLDGGRYVFDFYTNRFDGFWYMDVGDSEGNPVVQGIRVVTGLDLLYRFQYLDVPPGQLFVNDLVGEREDPTLNTWQDGGAELYYLTTT